MRIEGRIESLIAEAEAAGLANRRGCDAWVEHPTLLGGNVGCEKVAGHPDYHAARINGDWLCWRGPLSTAHQARENH